jgi:hypothetical protein
MAMNNSLVSVRHHGELTPPHPGDELVAVSVGPSGEAVALWSTAAGQTTLLGRVPERPPVPARIATYWPDPGPVVEIAEFDLAFPIPAPMPDGRVLAVASRCRWRPGGPDPNAVIFDDAGLRVGEGVVGDGIEHMFTTSAGDIWVAYFDEGVFGNYGWGGPGPTPIGAPGIVRFGADLSLRWSFPMNTSMADCYAFNVDDPEIWACYYTEFPIARIADDAVRHWTNAAARGPRALIIAGTRCVLVGGYGPDSRGGLLVGELGDSSFVPISHHALDLPAERVRYVARGNELNVFAGNQWYKLDEQL